MAFDWEIEGPDQQGHVWIIDLPRGDRVNLGPLDQAAEKLATWLDSRKA